MGSLDLELTNIDTWGSPSYDRLSSHHPFEGSNFWKLGMRKVRQKLAGHMMADDTSLRHYAI